MGNMTYGTYNRISELEPFDHPSIFHHRCRNLYIRKENRYVSTVAGWQNLAHRNYPFPVSFPVSVFCLQMNYKTRQLSCQQLLCLYKIYPSNLDFSTSLISVNINNLNTSKIWTKVNPVHTLHVMLMSNMFIDVKFVRGTSELL